MSPELAAIIIAAITSAGSLITAMINHRKIGELTVHVNSQLDAALAAQRELGRAEGRAEKPGPHLT